MPRISALTELTTAEPTDMVPLYEESTGVTKKISVKNLVGIVDLGFTAAGESWSYSAWSSTLKRGTITVPSDGTTKYAPGMFVRFSQSTGGVKYGKIISVTTTTIVVFMDTYTLNNEAISSPVYALSPNVVGLPETIKNHNPYMFSAYRAGSWSVGNGVSAIVPFETEDYDNNGDFDTATGKYTAPVSGYYEFSAGVQYVSVGNPVIIITSIGVNSTSSETKRLQEKVTASSGNSTHSGSVQLKLTAGDYVCVLSRASNNSGGTGSAVTYFTGRLVSRT